MFSLVEFSELYFTRDWPKVKEAFLKRYSNPFTVNKKKELNIEFNEETSLRSFVERKLRSLALYTSLPYINQVEMMLYDFPIEIANLFLVNEKMNSKKSELLEFCDSIQDLVQTMLVGPDEEIQTIQQDQMNRMQIFKFDPDLESDDRQSEDLQSEEMESMPSSRGSGRSRGPGRPRKMLNSDSASSDMSVCEHESVEVRVKAKRGGKAIVVGRSTKPLNSIEEDIALNNFKQISDEEDSSSMTRSIRSTRPTRLARSKPYTKYT